MQPELARVRAKHMSSSLLRCRHYVVQGGFSAELSPEPSDRLGRRQALEQRFYCCQERNKFVLDRSGENPVFDYANEYKAEELFRAHRKPHTEVCVPLH
jgi:hypothetical protein